MTAALLVLAKEPRPGFAKTRLVGPLTPAEAAALARASLADTLRVVAAVGGVRRILVLDGEVGPWVPRGVEVAAQRSGGLDERIAGAFATAGGPALLIGMDTPQVTPHLLERALEALRHAPAVLGPASDGGWWAMGLREPVPEAVLGLPMSVAWTCAAQRQRLDALGLDVAPLPELRDVDVIADAEAVAHQAPHTAFARMFRSILTTRGRSRADRRAAGG